MVKYYFTLCLFLLGIFITFPAHEIIAQKTGNKPFRLAVAGITHGHVPWILGRENNSAIELVGIFETNKELVKKYALKFNLDIALFYSNLEKMLDEVKPEGLVAFGSIYEHMAAVEAAAPRSIHVMVEKPLATNLDHAVRMQSLSAKHNIHILTNYETSWFPSTHKVYELAIDSNYAGAIKKAVFHHGHQGPKEIGVENEFLEWLTDPVQNGGGALIDFGCYGANIMTWLMKDEKPISVQAVTRQFKPGIYPRVDDEATIIVSYPSAQCIIQASWNWPFGRKDMEIYGENGYVMAVDGNTMRIRNDTNPGEQTIKANPVEPIPEADPFLYFAGVVRGNIIVPPHGLYSLENNIMVVRILEAARESAKTGKTILLKD